MNDDVSIKKQEDLERKHKDSKIKKKDEVKQLKSKIEDLEDQLKRAIADYRNLEKRVEEERQNMIKFANRELLLRLIPALDALFFANKLTQDEGVSLTVESVNKALADVGVERIKTEGGEFNAQLMEAVSTGDGEENKVLEEIMPGYILHGKLVRPAQVKVGKPATRD